MQERLPNNLHSNSEISFTPLPSTIGFFTPDYAREKLLTQFEVQSLKGFGVEEMEMAQIAAGAILHYLATTENTNLNHVNSISRIEPDRYVWLDRFTIRNLELIYSPHENGVTLLGCDR